jgi:hypothetical protein
MISACAFPPTFFIFLLFTHTHSAVPSPPFFPFFYFFFSRTHVMPLPSPPVLLLGTWYIFYYYNNNNNYYYYYYYYYIIIIIMYCFFIQWNMYQGPSSSTGAEGSGLYRVFRPRERRLWLGVCPLSCMYPPPHVTWPLWGFQTKRAKTLTRLLKKRKKREKEGRANSWQKDSDDSD